MSGVIDGTRLESVEEIRAAVRAQQQGGAAKAAAPSEDTVAYRPLRRPPMALLCVLDDGSDEGQWVRLRDEATVIGRSEGDILIPHDSVMSTRHAAIVRQVEQDRYRWYLTDLHSTNGTFVRVGKALLAHGQELLLGGRRYRFQAAAQANPTASQAAALTPKGTSGWQSVAPTSVFPSLLELTPQGEGTAYLLRQAENWLGRDAAQCGVVLANDPLVSPRHARLYRDAKGRWLLENAKSLNGIWLRVDRMPFETTCHFQLGEQRFLVRVPS